MSWREKMSNELLALRFGATVVFHVGNASVLTVLGIQLAFFIDSMKLGIPRDLEMTLGVVLVFGAMITAVLFYRHYTGRVWFDCGWTIPRTLYLILAISMATMVAIGVNLEAPPPKDRLYDASAFRPTIDFAEAVYICSLAFYFLLLSFTKDQICERGFWLQFRLLPWETITSYNWTEIRDGAYDLSLRTNVIIPFLCCGTLRIPAKWKPELDERLRKHILANVAL